MSLGRNHILYRSRSCRVAGNAPRNVHTFMGGGWEVLSTMASSAPPPPPPVADREPTTEPVSSSVYSASWLPLPWCLCPSHAGGEDGARHNRRIKHQARPAAMKYLSLLRQCWCNATQCNVMRCVMSQYNTICFDMIWYDAEYHTSLQYIFDLIVSVRGHANNWSWT